MFYFYFFNLSRFNLLSNILMNLYKSLTGYKMCAVMSFQASDTHSTGKVMVAIVKNCFEAKNWDALNENIVLLTKKRGQIKQVSVLLLGVCP